MRKQIHFQKVECFFAIDFEDHREKIGNNKYKIDRLSHDTLISLLRVLEGHDNILLNQRLNETINITKQILENFFNVNDNYNIKEKLENVLKMLVEFKSIIQTKSMNGGYKQNITTKEYTKGYTKRYTNGMVTSKLFYIKY